MWNEKHTFTALDRTTLGKFGEDVAVNHLLKKGYRIRARNFWIPLRGELDIIAEKKRGWFFRKIEKLIFVEVKTISVGGTENFFPPENHFTKSKFTRIQRLGMLYLSRHKIPLDIAWQIDLIAVEVDDASRETKSIRHYENISLDTFS